MTSQDGMYDLCTLLTVTESLKRNGVKNPVAALQGYCRALSSHCHDEGYTKLMKAEGFSKAKKITSWDMYELSKNFDFQKHIDQILNL